MEEKANDIKNPPFAFRRLGGMNQFVLQTDEEWQNLSKLDKKLWMALSCPIQGLEFSAETLALLDADGDGRVRVQDVKEAVEWLCERLIHPSRLAEGQAEVEIDNLKSDTPGGQQLVTAARLVLEKQNVPGVSAIRLDELEKVVAEASSYPFNGDGIVPPDSAPLEKEDVPIEKNMEKYIRLAISIVGAKKDASGKPGLDEELAKYLDDLLSRAKNWRSKLRSANLPLGENTAEVWTLYNELKDKLDDYYCRCRLLAYAPEASAQINDDQLFQQSTQGNPENNGLLSGAVLENLPLARANMDCILDLQKGLNPAWEERLTNFVAQVGPLASISGLKMEEGQWKKIKSGFAEYSAILADKPVLETPPQDAQSVSLAGFDILCLAPAGDPLGRSYLPRDGNFALSSLSDQQLDEMLAPETASAFASLVSRDKAAPPLAAFQELRKLALFHANLYTFLNNFLSFTDFYTPEKKAIFQSGTLYLDGRACFLCVPVEDIDNHARLSEQSHLCLIYCACQRKDTDGAEASMTVAAALTVGNVASLIEGRHGLFIDNAGNEWDTRIIKILHNPISLEEAVWAPYIRLSNMVSEQVHKFIAAKDKAIEEHTDKLAAAATTAPAEAVRDAPKPGFDFAKGAGIFAALSVALSVLSAAFAYIANSVASLGWWWPLAIVLVFICISGPSVILAWFKLRKRGLGPLLDASAWAVNNAAPINIMMGATLTKPARLPRDARKELNDPYAVPEQVLAKRRRRRNWLIFWCIVLLCIACFGAWCYFVHTPAWVVNCWNSIWSKIAS